jgi:thiamine biosynthesis lipoprotein
LQRFEFTQIEMAVDFRIVLYADDEPAAETAAEAAFDRIHQLNAVLSDYDAESELRRLCATAGQGRRVRVSDDLWSVLTVAQQIAEKSDGAFDATCGEIVRLWRRARRQKELPDPDRLQAAREVTGHRLLRLDPAERTAELLKPDMRIDLGGVAKGFATQEALRTLRAKGFSRAMIEGGGDLAIGDPPPERPGWRIGVAPPAHGQPPRCYIAAANRSVATSGDMWQFAVIGGTRYSHIVDPRTGVGLTERIAVTVVGPDGATTDALSTAVSVLGAEKGLALVETFADTAALIVCNVDGKDEVRESKRWRALLWPPAAVPLRSALPQPAGRPGWPRGPAFGQWPYRGGPLTPNPTGCERPDTPDA